VPVLSDDGKSHWDPTAPNPQTGGIGAWVPGTGDDPGVIAPSFIPPTTSNPTSEAADRYRGMGQTGGPSTPAIDTTRSDETRGVSMGALGLMRDASEGKYPSEAERLGTLQGQNAQNAQHGIAASVRGGAATRAAAARGAVATAGTIGQQAAASNQATRAGEMDKARASYFGASTGQREKDLGLAGSKADLETGNRRLLDQREGFYEDLADDTKKQHALNEEGVLAGNLDSANASNADDARERDRLHKQNWDYLNMGVSAAQGGANAAGAGGKPSPSDEKAKTNVEPLSGSAAKRLRDRTRAESDTSAVKAHRKPVPPEDLQKKADALLSQIHSQAGAQLENGPSVGSRVRARAHGEDTSPLVEDLAAAQASAPVPPERKMNPENPYTRSLFGHAEPGYASGRAGEAGGMFGEHLAGASTIRDENRNAPGTRDFYAGSGEVHDPFSRKVMGLPAEPPPTANSVDVMTSDVAAKQQAFRDGAEWSLNNGEGGVPGYMPRVVASGGGAKRSDTPARGKDSTKEAALESYPTDPSKRTPEDNANVAQLKQYLDDNEGDAYTRAHIPGQGPPAKPLNPRIGTEDEGVPRTSVANDMRKRTREYVTSQDRGEPPVLKKSQDRKAQEKGAETPSSSPSTTSEGERYDTSNRLGSGTGKRIAPEFMKGLTKRRSIGPQAFEDAGRRLTRQPTRGDLLNDEQDRQIHSNQVLSDKLQNIQAKGEISDLRSRIDDLGVTPSDERTKSDIHFGGPMAEANRSMTPSIYEYKEPFAAEEGQAKGDKNVGPIAQTMEKDPVASTVIVHDPETGLLGIDKAKGLKLVMGGLSDLQRQVDELHGKKKGSSSHGR